MNKQIFITFLLILTKLTTIDSTHFNGGTITWYPVNPSTNSSSVTITIVQTYSWVYPSVKCDVNVPSSTGNPFYFTVDLTCIANCTTDGGYSTKQISMTTDCISSSSSLGIMTSRRAVNITLTSTAHFTLAYQSYAWRTIRNSNSSTAGWSIATLIDLRKRPDGVINTPPVSTVASPQYLVANRTTLIKIPLTDANDDDDLRCRWAMPSGSSTNANECDDACYPSGFPSGVSLSNCVLTFTGPTPNAWYVVSIQVEDFINTTSSTPMSSVPVQFLIYVMANLSCTIEPVFLPLTNCFEVQVGTPVNLSLYVMNYCNRSKSIITDIIDTVSINGMTVGNVTNSTTNTSLSYVTLNWTPQTSQLGQQQFCAIAYTNENVQSTEYCVTFIVRTVSTFCRTTTTTTTSTTSKTTTTTTTTTTSSTTSSTKTTSTSTSTSTASTTSTSVTTTTSITTTTSTTTSTATTTTTTKTTTTSTTTKTTTSTTTSTSTSTSTTSTTTTTSTSSTTSSSTTTTTTTTTKTTTTSTTTQTTTSSTSSTSTTSSTTTTTSATTTSTTTTQTTTSTSSTTSITTTTTTTTQTTTSSTTTITTTTDTTTSSATTTSTTSTTTTVTTTTSITSTTSTSVTTVTDTTTTNITLAPKQINIALIVGLSLLALLLALCCGCLAVYYFLFKSSRKKSLRSRISDTFKQQKYSIANPEARQRNKDIPQIFSTNDRTDSVLSSSMSGKRARSKLSTVSVHPLDKMPSVPQLKLSDTTQSKTSFRNEQPFDSASTISVKVVKLTRHDTEKSSRNQAKNDRQKIDNTNHDLDIIDYTTRSYANNSLRVPDQNVIRKAKSNSTIERQASSFRTPTVAKIKKSPSDLRPTRSDLNFSQKSNQSSSVRVKRLSSKRKKRSAIQPFQSDN